MPLTAMYSLSESAWVSWRLCPAPGFVEPDYWNQATVVGWCRSSNSIGVIMPSAECRRWRLWKTSRYSKRAVASSSRVFHRFLLNSST